MAELSSLRDVFIEEIRDLYSTEQQLVKALPKMVKAATNPGLRTAIEAHLEETHDQVRRLEEIFELLDERPKAKHCAGIAGIIEEAAETLKEDAPPALMDARIIAGGQRAEHYEMAAYGTVIAWAEALELTKIARLLTRTLEEEKAADQKLSALAEGGINKSATAGDEGEEDEDKEPSGTSRSRSAARKRA